MCEDARTYKPPIRVGYPRRVTARSKACFCGRSLAGIASSNPAGGMDVCCVLSGIGFCDGPIPRPEEFYRVCRV